MSTRLAVSLSILALAALSSACDDGGSDGNTDVAMQGSDTVTGTGDPLAENCQSRCETKAVSCQAPPSTATEICGGLCGQSVTESQAQCLESSECSALTSVFIGGGGTICDIGSSTSGTCGDGTCGSGETSSSCPSDCGMTTTPASCGDGVCDTSAGETLSNCFSDCDTETGGSVGDDCSCGDATLECTGTENGCRFTLSGSDSLRCFVNGDDQGDGFCSDSCEPDGDPCPDGGSCGAFLHYITNETVYRCE